MLPILTKIIEYTYVPNMMCCPCDLATVSYRATAVLQKSTTHKTRVYAFKYRYMYTAIIVIIWTCVHVLHRCTRRRTLEINLYNIKYVQILTTTNVSDRNVE